MNITRKQKIKYGDKDLLSHEPIDAKKAKVRISLWIDGDVLLEYKKKAKHSPDGEYQPLMRKALRDALDKSTNENPFSEAEVIALKSLVKRAAGSGRR